MLGQIHLFTLLAVFLIESVTISVQKCTEGTVTLTRNSEKATRRTDKQKIHKTIHLHWNIHTKVELPVWWGRLGWWQGQIRSAGRSADLLVPEWMGKNLEILLFKGWNVFWLISVTVSWKNLSLSYLSRKKEKKLCAGFSYHFIIFNPGRKSPKMASRINEGPAVSFLFYSKFLKAPLDGSS